LDSDPINPSHYKIGNRELIDILKDLLTPAEFKGLLKGSIYQYLFRYEKKGGREDLEKCAWYLERLKNEYIPPESHFKPRTEALDAFDGPGAQEESYLPSRAESDAARARREAERRSGERRP